MLLRLALFILDNTIKPVRGQLDCLTSNKMITSPRTILMFLPHNIKCVILLFFTRTGLCVSHMAVENWWSGPLCEQSGDMLCVCVQMKCNIYEGFSQFLSQHIVECLNVLQVCRGEKELYLISLVSQYPSFNEPAISHQGHRLEQL